MSKINNGIWTSLITPFDESGKFDAESGKKYVEFLDQYDFAGFLLAGSVGEGMLMSVGEIQEYAKIVRSISKKPIMLCIADFNFARAQERLVIDHDYLCVTPCIYYKPTADMTIEYFRKIAETAQKPVLVYNNPGRVGVAITDYIYDALAKMPNVIGTKDCEDEKFVARSNKYDSLVWFTGDDPFMVPEFLNNKMSAGVISTMSSIAPKEALESWNTKQATRWLELCGYSYSLPNPVAIKLVLAHKGIIKTPKFRAPFDPLPEFKYVGEFLQYV